MTYRNFITLTIAEYMIQQEPNTKSIIEMFNEWKSLYQINIRHPENARFALVKISELSHLTTRDKRALAETIRLERMRLYEEQRNR